jgi:hypothetical protein
MNDETVHDLRCARNLIEDAAHVAAEGEGDVLTEIRDSLAGASALLDRVLSTDEAEPDDDRPPFELIDGGATDEEN